MTMTSRIKFYRIALKLLLLIATVVLREAHAERKARGVTTHADREDWNVIHESGVYSFLADLGDTP